MDDGKASRQTTKADAGRWSALRGNVAEAPRLELTR